MPDHENVPKQRAADEDRTIEDDALEAKRNNALRHGALMHNPQDTFDAVAQAAEGYTIRVNAISGPEGLTPDARAEAERLGIDPANIRAWYSPESDKIYINAAKVRPSEVPGLLLHEAAVHKGLPAVLGKQYDAVMDSIYGQFREEIETVNELYHYDLESEDERRMATEEYLAERAEFCGHDWRAYAESHEEEIEEYIAEHGLSRENRKGAVRGLMAENGELELRPSRWKEFLQRVKMFFRKWKGFENYRFTDQEIETLIMRGLRKARGKNKPDRTDRQDRFAAALRREGAPNRAEERFLLRDGNVPCAEGFMEWAGLKGKGLYADYEFLLGRHPQYFEDQEHVRAAVELVLSKPEQVQDMAEGKNASFVGFDEETGAIYRIEIEKDVKNKRNHLRSVFEINADQYNKIKLDSSRVLQPSPTEADKQSAGRTLSSFLRYDTPDSGKVKGDGEKFSGNDRFSVEAYSEEDWGNMVTFMKPFVGRAMERGDADYLKHLRDNGFDAASESDAHAVAAEALKANQRDARAAGKKAMYDWLILNDYWFGRVYDAIGKTDFLIRPSHRFIGEDFTGSFISPEFVKYSGKKKVKDKEGKLAKAKGYHSDELAKLIASKTGEDELEVEQQLIDYFRDLKKRASKADKENGQLGLYDQYSEWKASSPLLSAKLDEKLKAEWEAEKQAQLEGSAAWQNTIICILPALPRLSPQ